MLVCSLHGYMEEAEEIGVKPFRRVLLLVNPVGGKGKGRAIVKDQVLPLLEAAGCIVDVQGELLD